ncbi:hypothetical protein [Photobacterium sanguinicancri]|uniref:Uncharacterized protein n=1 Tax=Photobacterium sanguinicancri TaxID=875932 RepID=A0AAW7Y8E2_9GAMM|nr:hypothetical protein [Photobacterium sanguinicancri]MDO6544016.1 hypothetical protein [Photobacterium sanguinicancri]
MKNSISITIIFVFFCGFYFSSVKASEEWLFPPSLSPEGVSDVLGKDDDLKEIDWEGISVADMNVTITYTSTLPGSWRISAKWGKSKHVNRTIQAPKGFKFCRGVTHQRGNKGGLSQIGYDARSVTLKLYTNGGSFNERWTGWQEGWYDIMWISDNANKTYRDAHSCI